MTEWLTLDQAGNFLGVSVRTVQRYIKSGKLKTKTVKGRKSLKKDTLTKLKSNDASTSDVLMSGQDHDNDNQTSNVNKTENGLVIPTGYILIDKETLDSLRIQIKTLTDNVGEMQLTQKMLIEKGLNLKQNENNDNLLESDYPTVAENKPDTTTQTELKPIEEIAKVHEDFFGKKKSNNLYYYIMGFIIIGFIAFIAVMYLNGV